MIWVIVRRQVADAPRPPTPTPWRSSEITPASLCRLNGSYSNSVQGYPGQRQHPSTKQVNAGAAIRSPLRHLQYIIWPSARPLLQGSNTALHPRPRYLVARFWQTATYHKMPHLRASFSQMSSLSSVSPRSRPRNRSARCRIVVNSADDAFSASTFAICRAVCLPIMPSERTGDEGADPRD